MQMFSKARRDIAYLGIIGLVLFSAGCVGASPPASPGSLTVPTEIKTQTVISPTPMVIETFPKTPTLTSPAPLTPQPTLSKEAKQALVLSLLAKNGDCTLPCWWGITPGKTAWIDAKSLLESEGLTLGEPSKYQGLNVYGIRGGLDLFQGQVSIYESFGESDGILNNITLSAGGFDENRFRSVFINYSVQHVLSVYGKPSRILLQSHASFDSRSSAGYVLWLFYDHLGFLLKYSGSTAYGKIYHICPKFESGGNIKIIDIYLTHPNNPAQLENLSGYSDYQNGYIFPIDELGASVDGFYKSFSTSDAACLNVPSNKYDKP